MMIAALGVALFLLIPLPGQAEAQNQALLSASATSTASDVVNGTVIAVQSVDRGIEVHTVAVFDVSDAVQGSLSGQIFVEVPGGQSSSGITYFASHQPYLEVGSNLQLALTRAPLDEQAALTGDVPVYSIVGGVDGAAALSGEVRMQAEAMGDYTLTGYKWGSMPVPYAINPANSGLGSSVAVSAVRAGLQMWVDDAGSDVSFNYGGTTGASPNSYSDGSNTIGWVDTPNSADTYLALALWGVDSQGNVLDFDIKFNRDYNWSSGAAAGRFDAVSVAAHEIGHVLGLGHTSADNREIMFPSFTSGQSKVLGAGDLSGIQHLYPAAAPPLPDGSPFVDTPAGAFYTIPAHWAYQQGISTGTSATTFSPNAKINRAELALMLHRYAGSPEPHSEHPFVDIPIDAIYDDAVSWLAETGITTGTSATTYSPRWLLTRGQMATFLWRYEGEPAPASSSSFGDVKASAFYATAVAWMSEQGITTGTSATTYSPNQNLTRGHVVTFLYRHAGEPEIEPWD